MSALDQAFIKAFSKGTGQARPARTATIDATTQSAAGTSVSSAEQLSTAPLRTNPPHFSVESSITSAQSESRPLSQLLSLEAAVPTIGTGDSRWRLDEPHALAATDAPPGHPTILPLSAFTPKQEAAEPFRPAFEVDQFGWPESCTRLLAVAGSALGKCAEALREAARQQDRKVIALTGCRRGEGRSQLLIALAKTLSQQGVKAAVVDGDFQTGQLARQLGLAVRVGFDDVLAGELSLPEVLVESIADGLTLLPLRERIFEGIELKDKFRLAAALGSLREQYDLVLVDAGPATNLDQPRVHCFDRGSGLDAAVIVRDARQHDEETLATIARGLAAAGIECLGVAENFVRQVA